MAASYEIDPVPTRQVQFRPAVVYLTCLSNIDERAQRSQPGFVASPALDGRAIDRLPGLPLAGSLHRARIGFGAQACVVPRQAAGRDDPPDDWFGRAGEVLVIDLDETIRRQHAPPMLDEPLVAAEICDQFCASGLKRQDG